MAHFAGPSDTMKTLDHHIWQRFLAIATPYWRAKAEMENPSIYVSDDGANWQVPAGASNPITPASVTGALRLSEIREERAAYPVLDRLLAGAHDAAVGGKADR